MKDVKDTSTKELKKIRNEIETELNRRLFEPDQPDDIFLCRLCDRFFPLDMRSKRNPKVCIKCVGEHVNEVKE